ncbi:unnamed protein product [Prorocentrum cordatum]|uniref:Uncharacterized protein n=1 Tax=Prorocentrum cordatum TaxID=2364126 RepID=A0ABN9WU72_9DINO|nr:unnamed protein product [Polarella glacialis]
MRHCGPPHAPPPPPLFLLVSQIMFAGAHSVAPRGCQPCSPPQMKVSDGKVQFWARTSLPAPDTWERCWHAETDLPSSFVDDRPVNPFSRSVPVLGMKPAKEPGDRFELNLSPTEQVRFSVENRSRLRSILLEDRGGGSGGGGGHDVVVTVTKWATAPLGKGTFDPASLGCADLHVPGREVNRWLERWALLRVFLPGPPSGGKDPDPARLLQGASGAKELPELYAV